MNVFNTEVSTKKPMKEENSDSDSEESISEVETSGSTITESGKENQSDKSEELSKNNETSNNSFSSYFTLTDEDNVVQVSKITNKKVHEVGHKPVTLTVYISFIRIKHETKHSMHENDLILRTIKYPAFQC